MRRFDPETPARVREIVFKDGFVLRDKAVLIVNPFVVVMDGDDLPTFYNVDFIEKLSGVEPLRTF